MKSQIEVEKLTVSIGDKQIELTPAQARQLHEKLGDLLGIPKERVVLVDRHPPYFPPSIWYHDNVPQFGPYEITCGEFHRHSAQ